MKNGFFTILAVFLTLAATSAANAQDAAPECELNEVYSPIADTHDGGSGAWRSEGPEGITLNLEGTLSEIVASLDGNQGSYGDSEFFELRVSGGEILADNTIPADNIPHFNGNDPAPGDHFLILDIAGIGNADLNTRVYTRDSDTMLGLTQLMSTVSKCADHLTAREFFLDSNWAETRTADNGNQGAFNTLTCQPGEIFAPPVVGEDSRCIPAPPPPPNCDETTAQFDGVDACRCINDGDGLNDDGLSCSASSQTQPPINTGGDNAATPAADDDDLQGVLQVAAGVGVIGFFLAYAAGDASNFAFSPDVGYSIDESGYAYNYGGRLDFNKDRWHLYWTAGQANTNGDFGDLRYSSGGSYAADFWTASFSEKVSGDAADYDLSLSAKYGDGVWEVSPAYRVHFGFEETASGVKSETENALNLEGVLRANRWTVRSTAGFRWESAEDFADKARFGISAVRNL